MRTVWTALAALALMQPVAAHAESFPGRASGSIGDRAFDFALDCKGWQGDDRMVFAADDDRNGADTNGDGVALSFNYFAPMNTTNAQLTLDGQVHYMGSGVVQLEDAPVWEVTDDGARWLGEVPTPDGMAMADVTIDCAPREAAARGLTGRVSGNFGEIAVDAALSCETWGTPKVELSTEEATRPRFQAFYVTQMNAGGLVVTTEERRIEVAAVDIMKTGFDVTPDALRFVHDIRDKQTGATIPVDLTFDCAER